MNHKFDTETKCCDGLEKHAERFENMYKVKDRLILFYKIIFTCKNYNLIISLKTYEIKIQIRLNPISV